MTSSQPNYLPKAPPPKTTTLEVRISTYDFWNINIHYLSAGDEFFQCLFLLRSLLPSFLKVIFMGYRFQIDSAFSFQYFEKDHGTSFSLS